MIDKNKIQELLLKIEEYSHAYDVVNNQKEYRRNMPYNEEEYGHFYDIVKETNVDNLKNKLYIEYYSIIEDCKVYKVKDNRESYKMRYIKDLSKNNFIAKECLKNYMKLSEIEKKKTDILEMCNIMLEQGLKDAIEKYDYRRNSSIGYFENYARYYLRGAFWEEIINNSIMERADIKVYAKMSKIILELVQCLCKEEQYLRDFEIAIWWLVKYSNFDEATSNEIISKIIVNKKIDLESSRLVLNEYGISENKLVAIINQISRIRNGKYQLNMSRLDGKNDKDDDIVDSSDSWFDNRTSLEINRAENKSIGMIFNNLTEKEKIVYNHCYKFGKYNSDLKKYDISQKEYYRIIEVLTNKILKGSDEK